MTIEFLLILALFAPLAWLLERTHRRTATLPRAPFGADADSEATATYRRQIAELREMAQLADREAELMHSTRSGGGGR